MSQLKNLTLGFALKTWSATKRGDRLDKATEQGGFFLLIEGEGSVLVA